ncbi:hypothetical protein NDU88_003350 [Pleurodeles waltl]|uniref:Uncharacterized protein n=1 Tax=Pleurodeles waltl TaxID=8319 RepID=A0AAV7W6M5_PLEWA|nr:hypothetical protein NDU88_003350 [Pleurodeles waltl]
MGGFTAISDLCAAGNALRRRLSLLVHSGRADCHLQPALPEVPDLRLSLPGHPRKDGVRVTPRPYAAFSKRQETRSAAYCERTRQRADALLRQALVSRVRAAAKRRFLDRRVGCKRPLFRHMSSAIVRCIILSHTRRCTPRG